MNLKRAIKILKQRGHSVKQKSGNLFILDDSGMDIDELMEMAHEYVGTSSVSNNIQKAKKFKKKSRQVDLTNDWEDLDDDKYVDIDY